MTSDAINNLSTKIKKQLVVSHLEIIDESHLHAGHSGARPEGNSHFKAIVVSADFDGISRIKRHQMIYSILKDEMKSHIHALAITALTPQEYSN